MVTVAPLSSVKVELTLREALEDVGWVKRVPSDRVRPNGKTLIAHEEYSRPEKAWEALQDVIRTGLSGRRVWASVLVPSAPPTLMADESMQSFWIESWSDADAGILTGPNSVKIYNWRYRLSMAAAIVEEEDIDAKTGRPIKFPYDQAWDVLLVKMFKGAGLPEAIEELTEMFRDEVETIGGQRPSFGAASNWLNKHFPLVRRECRAQSGR